MHAPTPAPITAPILARWAHSGEINAISQPWLMPPSEKVNLNGRRLRTLPGFSPCLKELRAAGNELESIPETISEYSQLRVLELGNDVMGNRIAKLPPSITMLANLEVLNLASNQLHSLPPLHLPRLKQLILSRNQLRQLPELRLPNLEEMRLDDNRLTRLPLDDHWIPSLLLDLSGNLLRFIPAYLAKVRRVLLCGNPCLQSQHSAPIVEISNRIPRLTDLCWDAMDANFKMPNHLSAMRCAQCPGRFGCPAARLIHDAPFQCHPQVCLTADLCHRCIGKDDCIAIEVGSNGAITLIDIEDL